MKRIIFIVTTLFFIHVSSQAQSTFNITTSSTPSCQDNGTLTINFNGGVPPYSLTVFGNGTLICNLNNIQTASHTLNNLGNGGYTVISNNILTSARQNIIIPSSISTTTTVSAESCEGNGSILTNTPSGGQAPYSYLWSNGATTQNITNVISGRYTFKITDNNGCIFHSDSLIIQKTPAINIAFINTDNDCTSKGSSNAVPEGGTGPYTYLWNTSPIQTTATASGLDEGMYTVKVTDISGCSVTENSYIQNTVNFNLNSVKKDEDCRQANGEITLNPSGGQAPYTYIWNTGATTAAITGLESELYSVVVTDNLNCSAKTNYFYISRLSPLQISTMSTDANCSATGGGGGSVVLTVSNGAQPYTYAWSNGTTNANLTNVSAGWYHTTVTDANNCTALTYGSINELTTCYVTITGKVFNDANENCVQDVGELGFPYCLIKYDQNKHTYTDAYGNYSFTAIPNTYTLEVIPVSNWESSCSSNTLTVNASIGGNVYADNNLFVKATTNLTDVSIYNYIGAQRPGFNGNTNIHYHNGGTVNSSGTITYTYSNDWDFVSSSPTPDTYDPATKTLTWSYNNLSVFESRMIDIKMSVASSLSLGTALNATCTIASTAGTDINLTNNSSVATTIVVGSFDPNDIQVSPQGEGENGYITTEEEMTYKIRFQNTGTYMAENVSISNQLDENLKDYTLTIIDASHAVQTQIKDNLLTFEFANIFLADSNANEPESHGYVIYKINRTPGLAAETRIYNQANIYFDYNTPIETNRVRNTIAISNATSAQLNNDNSVEYYPNPCSTQLNLRFNATSSSSIHVELYSATGQSIVLIDAKEVSQGEQSLAIDLTQKSIANGLYIMKTIINNQVFSKQVFIQK